MKITYFQRYHSKENVATANTMLLLSRLYHYSSEKFFRLLKTNFLNDSSNLEVLFNLQERGKKSVPDATITQESFKIIVETKMSDWFYSDQLVRHLESFSDEKHKVLISIAPELMDKEKKYDFEKQLTDYNSHIENPIIHFNTTFELLANAVQDVIEPDRDYEMQDVLDDYLEYCYHDNLITGSDSWQYLRVALARTTFDFNCANNIYYVSAQRGFRAHDYLGLYVNKSVRAIGKICAIIIAEKTPDGMKYKCERGELSERRKELIQKSIEDGYTHGYDLTSHSHRFFFVEQFYETDFRKATSGAPMGARVFNLTEILGTETLPPTDSIAESLKKCSWQ